MPPHGRDADPLGTRGGGEGQTGQKAAGAPGYPELQYGEMHALGLDTYLNTPQTSGERQRFDFELDDFIRGECGLEEASDLSIIKCGTAQESELFISEEMELEAHTEEVARLMMREEEAENSELEDVAWETFLLGWWASNNNGLQLHREEYCRAAEAWQAYCEILQEEQEQYESDTEGEDVTMAKEQLREHLAQEEELRLQQLIEDERTAAESQERRRGMEEHDDYKM